MKVLSILSVLLMIACSLSYQTTIKQRISYKSKLFMSTITRPLNLPTTFIECSRQAAENTRKAISNGEKLLEVEFPPLPLEYLEDSSSSARDISDANTRWALEFARVLSDLGNITIIYPDQAELDDAIKYVDLPGATNPYPNVTLATIRADSIKNAMSLDQIFTSIFGATIGGTVVGIPNTQIYVAVISSAQELPDLEKLHLLEPETPIVFFNLKLEYQRSDFGLPLFPSRDLHYRFLSKIKPAFLMRSRSFSTTLRRPPFVLNYSGLLFRNYPDKYQCILNTGNGKNKLCKLFDKRPTSAEFRDSLIEGLDMPGYPKEELKTRGLELWWEKDVAKELYSNWRT